MALKAVIFGLWDTIIFKGKLGDYDRLYGRLKDLFAFLKLHAVRPIVLSNRSAEVTSAGKKITLNKEYLKRLYETDIELIVTREKGLPPKPNKAVVDYIRDTYNLVSNEIIYIGNNQMDFRTAVNSQLLFLNAKWHRSDNEYGFPFFDPISVKQFIDLFCLKEHYWYFCVEDIIKFFSLAPFSTYKEEFHDYSYDARSAAKANTDRKDFFLKYVVSSIYFSGLYKDFDYIAVYPGHRSGFGNAVMNETLVCLGNFFRKRYIPDLIVRHADAIKQQTARWTGKEFDKILNQVNTICLKRQPRKSKTEAYKDFSRTIQGKTVLVVDDFCTEGVSLESARNFIEMAGGTVLGVSWLKTINKPYVIFKSTKKFNPFEEQYFERSDYRIVRTIPYWDMIDDLGASEELSKKYSRYLKYRRKETL